MGGPEIPEPDTTITCITCITMFGYNIDLLYYCVFLSLLLPLVYFGNKLLICCTRSPMRGYHVNKFIQEVFLWIFVHDCYCSKSLSGETFLGMAFLTLLLCQLITNLVWRFYGYPLDTHKKRNKFTWCSFVFTIGYAVLLFGSCIKPTRDLTIEDTTFTYAFVTSVRYLESFDSTAWMKD